MARVPYKRAEDATGETRAALERVDANIVRLLANAESAAPPVLSLIGAMLTKLALAPRLREAAILLVATRTGAPYEWTQHVPIAERVGLTTAEIAAIGDGDLTADCLDEAGQATLAFVDELLRTGRPTDPVFERLTAVVGTPGELVELVLLVGCYRMLADAMTAFDIDEDPPVPPDVFEATMDFLND